MAEHIEPIRLVLDDDYAKTARRAARAIDKAIEKGWVDWEHRDEEQGDA